MHWKTPESPRIKKAILETLRERVCKKWPELWKNNSWILHQDKAPAHKALSVKRYLADKRTPVLEHAPDLAPCDFFLFPKIKSALKGTRFESMEAVNQKTAELLKALTEKDFQHCFDQWKEEFGTVIEDEDGINIDSEKELSIESELATAKKIQQTKCNTEISYIEKQ
ncbi:putative mariner transposase [Trichonephila clavipes]|nr:putative mariner transposase [Trichonephila clavipes]